MDLTGASHTRRVCRLPVDKPCLDATVDRWDECRNHERRSKKRVRFAMDHGGRTLCTYHDALHQHSPHGQDQLLWRTDLDLSPSQHWIKSKVSNHRNQGSLPELVPEEFDQISDTCIRTNGMPQIRLKARPNRRTQAMAYYTTNLMKNGMEIPEAGAEMPSTLPSESLPDCLPIIAKSA